MEHKQLIATKTLVRIAEHGDKLIRLALFVSEMNAKYLMASTSFLDEGSSAPEIAEAFDKDLGSTAVMLKKVALIVESLNDEHISPELLSKYKPEDCDLRTLFPNNYDPQTGALTLFGVHMSKRSQVSSMDNNDVKSQIYQHVLGELSGRFSYGDFRKQISVLKKLQSSEKPTPASEDFQIFSHAMLLVSVHEWSDFYAHIMQSVTQEINFRLQLSFADRQLIDERIAGGRAMLDGVIKSSTYISKEGLVQVSSAHKGDAVLSDVVRLVREIDCIRAVEVDASSSLVKLHDMLKQIQSIDLKVPDAFELKVRLLGNYRASGMHMVRGDSGEMSFRALSGVSSPALRIVAVDPKAPTSLAHELAHFCDRDESDPARNALVQHFRQKMLDSPVAKEVEIPTSFSTYLLNSREVFARLGEIGFTLLRSGYQDGDSFEDMQRRASAAPTQFAGDRLAFDIAFSKDFSTYSGQNAVESWMYFDVSSWTPDEFALVRDFAKSLYQDRSVEFKAILKQRIEEGLAKYNTHNAQVNKGVRRVVREKTESQKMAELFSKISHKDLPEILSVIIVEGMVKQGDLSETLAMYNRRLGTGPTSRASIQTLYEQVFGLAESIKTMISHGYMADAHLTYETLARTAYRFGLLSDKPGCSALEISVQNDLSQILTSGEMLGCLSGIQKKISSKEMNATANIFRLPFYNTWSVKHHQAEQKQRAFETLSDLMTEIRQVLQADSGVPGILPARYLDGALHELNDFAKARLVGSAFHQYAASTPSLSENAFDFWHHAQKIQTMLSFASDDRAWLGAVNMTKREQLQRPFNVAALEWKLLPAQTQVAVEFVNENREMINKIPFDDVLAWVNSSEVAIKKSNSENTGGVGSLSHLLMVDYDDKFMFHPATTAASSDLLLEYLKHSSGSLAFQEHISVLSSDKSRTMKIYRPSVQHEMLLKDAYSGTCLLGKTPARLMSDFVKSIAPSIKESWEMSFASSSTLREALYEALCATDLTALQYSEQQLEAPWLASFGMLNAKEESGLARLHPCGAFFRSLMLDSDQNPASAGPSEMLVSGVHAALLSRVTRAQDVVALADYGKDPVLLTEHESVDRVAIAAMHMTGSLAGNAFSKMADAIQCPQVPAIISDEVNALKNNFDVLLRKAHLASPDAVEDVLYASMFAVRSYDAGVGLRSPSKLLDKGLMDANAGFLKLSMPLLMSENFLKPAVEYVDSAFPELPMQEPDVSMEFLQFSEIDLQHQVLSIGSSTTFDDAPILPLPDVSLSSFSKEVNEQLAYFLSINEDVPSAGFGPLMPKKHQLKLF